MDAAVAEDYIPRMLTILNGLLYISMIALVGVLGFGIYNLYRTDQGARSRSNQLMRMRVVVQAIAILILMGIAYFQARGG